MKKIKPHNYPNVNLTLEKIIDVLMENPNAFSFKYNVTPLEVNLLFMRLHINEQELYRYLTNLMNLYHDNHLEIKHSIEGLYMRKQLSAMSMISMNHHYNIVTFIQELRHLAWIGFEPCTKPHYIRMYNRYRAGASRARYYPDVLLENHPDSDTQYQSVLYKAHMRPINILP